MHYLPDSEKGAAMTIVFRNLPAGTITDSTSYQGMLYLESCQVECKNVIPNAAIYDDDVNNSSPELAHNPTIGVGFNLRSGLSLFAVM
jgi:hypothetical protein